MLAWTCYSVVVLFIVYHAGVLNATNNGADLEKRGAGTDRSSTGTGPTTPATPSCKISSLTLLGDDSYYYACCEGTTIAGPPEVVNWDCDPLRASYATLNESAPFYCGGITGEENARRRCDERWKWLASEGCFKWTECFKGVCALESKNRGSSVDASFCGDGRCDIATESQENCPSDCCGIINDECSVHNNTCPAPCCSTPSCCETPYSITNIWLFIIGGFAGIVFLITVLCCCCCFCCFRKCCHSCGSKAQVAV